MFRLILSLVNKSRGSPPTISTLQWSRRVPERADGLQLQPAFFKWLAGEILCHSRFQLLLNFVFNFHCLRTRFDADYAVSFCQYIALKQNNYRCTVYLLGKNILITPVFCTPKNNRLISVNCSRKLYIFRTIIVNGRPNGSYLPKDHNPLLTEVGGKFRSKDDIGETTSI